MIDSDEMDLVGVRRLPELLGELHDVLAVARTECIARNSNILPTRSRRSERARAAHQTEWHSQRAPPHRIGHEAEAGAVPRVGKSAGALQHLALDDILVGAREVD